MDTIIAKEFEPNPAVEVGSFPRHPAICDACLMFPALVYMQQSVSRYQVASCKLYINSKPKWSDQSCSQRNS